MSAQFSVLQKLIATSIQFSKSFNPTQPLLPQLRAHPLNSLLDIPFNFNGSIGKNIGQRTLFSHPQLRLSIFHIPHGVTMKLHDHPKMNVITQILQGSMKAIVFNKANQQDIGLCKQRDLYVKAEKMLKKGETKITGPQLDNFHQFSAVQQKCSFLDIIFPDYNGIDRVCTHYNFQKSQSQKKQLYRLKKLPADFSQPMCQI